jgi:hypothetical protein
MQPFTSRADGLTDAVSEVLKQTKLAEETEIAEAVEEIKKIVATLKVGDKTNFGKVITINADNIEFKAKDTPKTKIAFKARKMASKDFILDKLIKIKESVELDEAKAEYVSVLNFKRWFGALSFAQNALAKNVKEWRKMVADKDQYSGNHMVIREIDAQRNKIKKSIKVILDIHAELLAVGKINKSLQQIFIDALEDHIEDLEVNFASRDDNNFVVKAQLKDRKADLKDAKAKLKDLPTHIKEDFDESSDSEQLQENVLSDLKKIDRMFGDLEDKFAPNSSFVKSLTKEYGKGYASDAAAIWKSIQTAYNSFESIKMEVTV